MSFTRIKLAAAVLLLACLTLPEYTCTEYVGPDGKAVAAGPQGVPTTPYREVHRKHYPLESFNIRDIGSWVGLLVWVWPWPILAYGFRGRYRSLKRLAWVAEPVLSIGSGYAVWAASSLGTRAAGAYVAIASNAVYLGAWLAEVRRGWPGSKNEHKE